MSKITQKQNLNQKLSPQQILQAKLFQLNSFALEQRLYKEMEKNPLLELSDNNDVANDEQEPETQQDVDDFEIEELYSNTDDFELGNYSKGIGDFVDNIKSEKNDVVDNIKDQLKDLNLKTLDFKIAMEIIDNLDSKGYLSIEPILIADRFSVDENYINEIKGKINLLSPPGVASSNIKECLASQLIFHNYQDSNAFLIINNYFDDFSSANYDNIANELNITKQDIKDALDIISNLYLYPGDGSFDLSKSAIVPDLIMDKRNDQWVISVNDGTVPELILNSKYSDLLKDKKIVSETQSFIKKNYNNAVIFLDAIKQRKKTMIAVMHQIVLSQNAFFNSDKKILNPMILKDVAKSLSIDISTVSRICNGKYVQLPWGIFEMRSFFSEGVKMKNGDVISNTVLKEDILKIINNESYKKPLRDQDIVKLLDARGYQIARRTVSKYREKLNIPNSTIRKRIKALQN